MKGLRSVLGVVASVVVACGPRPADPKTTASPDPDASGEVVGLRPHVTVGQPLDLTIPLFDGGVVTIDQLNGRVVVLDIAGSWNDGWSEDQAAYQSLAAAYSEGLVVVTVALDPERSDLQAHWERDPLPFVLGWDPQGALAAKLRLTALPTVVVVDQRGVVTDFWSGSGPSQRERLRTQVSKLLGR